MFRSLLLLVLTAMLAPLQAQTVVFSDDFEGGTTAWTLVGGYGTSTTYAYGGSNSLTESPVGNYTANLNTSATLSTGLDLSAALDAQLSFWAIYDIEAGFDYCYVEASADGGAWINLATFDGEGLLSPWQNYTLSLGGFVGSSDVKIRFRFASDGAVEYDGMYIDDVEVVSFTTDLAPPLILYDGPELYEGLPGDFVLSAELVDISGIAATWVTYNADGGALDSVPGTALGSGMWQYVIPSQAPGALVYFNLHARDAAPSANTAMTMDHRYVAGNTIKYDNAEIDFVTSIGAAGLGGQAAAVRMSLPGTVDVVTMLLRNYTDPTRPNNDMQVHVWSDAGGFPGTDLITPFMVTPAATLSAPNQMTLIDLRPYSATLSGLSGDVWIGFDVPVGETWISQTTPGIGGRTSVLITGVWTAITDDYHFRIVSGPSAGAPEAAFSIDASGDPLHAFTDLSTNSPNSWDWTFGDGGTDLVANPSHTYAANGTYSVCLTAGNAVGSDTHCESVTVSGVVIPPVAAWSVDTTGDPTFVFTDLSTNSPDTWFWQFGDGATDVVANPSHTYLASGLYTVCLTASNSAGSSAEVCQDIAVRGVPQGIGMQQAGNLNLAPNPASGYTVLSLPNALAGEGHWSIHDATGRLMRQGAVPAGSAQVVLDVKGLAPGTYAITLRGQNSLARGSLQVIR